MSAIGRLLGALVKLFPASRVRHITRGWTKEPYLERYFIMRRTLGGRLPSVFLHRFVASDGEEFHNHPWGRSFSVILAGGYTEQRVVPGETSPKLSTLTLKPGSINVILADDFHRVELIGAECWTLFVAGPRVQNWGFVDHVTGAYLSWQDHWERAKRRNEDPNHPGDRR